MKTQIVLNGTIEDRKNLIIALVNSGYTVRLIDKKDENTRKTTKYVEYWKEEKSNAVSSELI